MLPTPPTWCGPNTVNVPYCATTNTTLFPQVGTTIDDDTVVIGEAIRSAPCKEACPFCVPKN